MRALASSAISYLLANTLLAGQGIAKIAGAPKIHVTPKNPPAPGAEGEKPATLAGDLYKRTRKTLNNFGDPAAVAFIAGDEYQTKAVNAVADFFTGSAVSPKFWSDFTSRIASQGSEAAAAFTTKRSLYLRQAKNTRYIFTLVRNCPEKLGIPRTGEIDLALYLGKAYGIGDFENIWTVEGLGHVYTQRTWHLEWQDSEDAHDILTTGQAAQLPAKSLTMMHAGLGLCFAESLMKQLTPASTTQETERVLSTFIRMCRNNSVPGYVGCALESLGLVTRCFNFPMVDLVQRVLSDLDPDAWEFFWRGAGRALYFSPGHMLQPLYSPWIAAEQEAPNERAYKILKAGISWPTNIVNMRHPEIFEDLIVRRGAAEEKEDTILHGVAASTTMALDITPDHPLVHEYLSYVPASADPEVRRLWTKLVHEPVYKAIHRYQPVLHAHKMMDQVFLFQDLDKLCDQLDPESAAARQPAEISSVQKKL